MTAKTRCQWRAWAVKRWKSTLLRPSASMTRGRAFPWSSSPRGCSLTGQTRRTRPTPRNTRRTTPRAAVKTPTPQRQTRAPQTSRRRTPALPPMCSTVMLCSTETMEGASRASALTRSNPPKVTRKPPPKASGMSPAASLRYQTATPTRTLPRCGCGRWGPRSRRAPSTGSSRVRRSTQRRSPTVRGCRRSSPTSCTSGCWRRARSLCLLGSLSRRPATSRATASSSSRPPSCRTRAQSSGGPSGPSAASRSASSGSFTSRRSGRGAQGASRSRLPRTAPHSTRQSTPRLRICRPSFGKTRWLRQPRTCSIASSSSQTGGAGASPSSRAPSTSRSTLRDT
mmetsp:Transcript_23312/g.58439  ORF Transcript_23312/g.58439 Transcript_23312/m.58439 type:complete len:340 (+) Transcript_23312:316-1335(+)